MDAEGSRHDHVLVASQDRVDVVPSVMFVAVDLNNEVVQKGRGRRPSRQIAGPDVDPVGSYVDVPGVIGDQHPVYHQLVQDGNVHVYSDCPVAMEVDAVACCRKDASRPLGRVAP